MLTETNTTVFIPTEGPMQGREIVEHVNRNAYLVFSADHIRIGTYDLDHPTATATWEPGKFYDAALHG